MIYTRNGTIISVVITRFGTLKNCLPKGVFMSVSTMPKAEPKRAALTMAASQ